MKDKQEQSQPKRELPELSLLEAELEREQYKQRYLRILRSTIYALIVTAAVAVLVATLWMPVLEIYGTSMAPTFDEGDIVVSVKSDNIHSGDLVAFYVGNRLLVKRCIAGPTDWVDLDEDGNFYINGAFLDEPYLTEKAFGECDLDLPYQVPEERWFLVGDHRETSVDSRNSVVGCISLEQIVGKIVFRVWPLDSFGRI